MFTCTVSEDYELLLLTGKPCLGSRLDLAFDSLAHAGSRCLTHGANSLGLGLIISSLYDLTLHVGSFLFSFLLTRPAYY